MIMEKPDLVSRGQPYWRVGDEDYVRKRDGVQIVLQVWRSFCAECGEPFVCRSVRDRPEVRRCLDHRRPGVKISYRKKAPSKTLPPDPRENPKLREAMRVQAMVENKRRHAEFRAEGKRLLAEARQRKAASCPA